jgi:hypothetical protein
MPINYTMIRVSQHVETYFLTRYPNVAVYEISSKLKVGKDVTIDTAKKLLLDGKDQKSYDLLENLGNPKKEEGKRKPKKEKLDDLCDTVCQIDAFMEEMKRLEYKVPQGYLLKTKASKGSNEQKDIKIAPPTEIIVQKDKKMKIRKNKDKMDNGKEEMK